LRKRVLVACDAGPLVALYEPSDQNHAACVRAAQEIPAPLATVWPVITEAVYILGRTGRPAGLQLLKEIDLGHLQVLGPGLEDLPRICALMSKYRKLPMDFADAALVVLCERQNIRTVFTTDRRGFSTYRPAHIRRLRILP
jgi:uncharacterized protein